MTTGLDMFLKEGDGVGLKETVGGGFLWKRETDLAGVGAGERGDECQARCWEG